MQFDTAIVGGGIAGYSAALTAKSLKLTCLWFGEAGFGKKTVSAEYVRNYPAFTGNGKSFVEALERQRKAEGIEITERRIDGVYRTADGFLLTAGQETFSARTVILATGVELGNRIAGEEQFLGRGVSYCAVCDGALYRGKTIAAVCYAPDAEEAEYLASFAKEVFLFSREPLSVKAENIRQIPELPVAVEGKERVEAVRTRDRSYAVSGVFLLGKTAPASVLVKGLKTDGAHVPVRRDCSTETEGLFAAGDVTGQPYQYIKAAGEGCVAAYSVKKYLKNNGE